MIKKIRLIARKGGRFLLSGLPLARTSQTIASIRSNIKEALRRILLRKRPIMDIATTILVSWR
jgi:hypothetical protein